MYRPVLVLVVVCLLTFGPAAAPRHEDGPWREPGAISRIVGAIVKHLLPVTLGDSLTTPHP
jgi:hypothetical protein